MCFWLCRFLIVSGTFWGPLIGCCVPISAPQANVLIDGSVARPIKPDLVFPGGQSQNISVSGLTIDDVNHWLANIPRNREVRRVVIHIGVNTCKFALVTESMWRQLIRKLKHVFPEAAVLVSSIVPPMGRLRKTAQVSNAVLLLSGTAPMFSVQRSNVEQREVTLTLFCAKYTFMTSSLHVFCGKK